LTELNFKRCPSKHGVYARESAGSRLVVGVYVDDLIITGLDEEEISKFKSEMKMLFKMSDLGHLNYYLGIEVHQNSGGIELCQASYAAKILDRASMTGCNPCHVPMEPRFKLSKNSTAQPVDTAEFRSIVGMLRYLIHTRPDLAFLVGFVSRFMEAPTMEHLMAVKHIMRYIAGTLNWGVHYSRGAAEAPLIGYSDSDLGGCIDTRRSTTGLMFFLGNNL
jgi:hypothetical protein